MLLGRQLWGSPLIDRCNPAERGDWQRQRKPSPDALLTYLIVSVKNVSRIAKLSWLNSKAKKDSLFLLYLVLINNINCPKMHWHLHMLFLHYSWELKFSFYCTSGALGKMTTQVLFPQPLTYLHSIWMQKGEWGLAGWHKWRRRAVISDVASKQEGVCMFSLCLFKHVHV